MPRFGRFIALALYAAMLAGVTWSMFYVRDEIAPRFATRKGNADWQAWRHEATGEGPVARREPKSSEPPLVILMRDFFAVCLAGAIVFSSLLFAVVAFVVRGAIKPPDAAARVG
jgi:hypothetical protein